MIRSERVCSRRLARWLQRVTSLESFFCICQMYEATFVWLFTSSPFASNFLVPRLLQRWRGDPALHHSSPHFTRFTKKGILIRPKRWREVKGGEESSWLFTHINTWISAGYSKKVKSEESDMNSLLFFLCFGYHLFFCFCQDDDRPLPTFWQKSFIVLTAYEE